MKKYLLFLLFLSMHSWAQMTVDNTTQTVRQTIINNLVGAGVTPLNVTFNGSAANALLVRDQVGKFVTNFNPTNLGLDTGMIMSTGNAQVAVGVNNSDSRSIATASPTAGDSDLALLSGQAIRNVSIVEFDFVATGPTLKFDYVFGSEEYPEFVNSINDSFGFFLRGPGIAGPYSGGAANIASVPIVGSSISINTVNNGTSNNGPCINCAFYYNNLTTGQNPTTWNPAFSNQYDGFTKNLSANANLICGQTYHIKLAIGNASDNFYDSAVFLKNFSIPPMVLVDGSGADTITSCEATYTIFSGFPAAGNTFVWTFNGVLIPTATSPNLTINANGVYELSVLYATGCLLAKDDITVNFGVVGSRNPIDKVICGTGTGPFSLNINQNVYMLNGASAADYNFVYHFGMPTGPIIALANLATYPVNIGDIIWVSVEDLITSGCTKNVSFTIILSPAPSGTSTYASPSYCDNVTAAQPTIPVTLTPGGTYTVTPPGLIINATTGAITPAGSIPNTYTVNYDVPVSPTCPAYNTSTTVEIKPVLTPTVNCGTSSTSSVEFTWPAVVGAIGYTVSYQIGASPVVTIGGIGNVLTYTVNSLSPSNTVVITVTPTGAAGTCFTSDTQSCVAISCTPPTASISYATPFCNSNTVLQSPTLTGTGLFTGGTYSIAPTAPTTPTAITINAITGQITPSASITGGSYVVTYSIPAAVVGCPVVTATTTIVINNQPNAGADGATTTCDSSTTAVNLAILITGEQTGGFWSRTAGTGGIFDGVGGTFTPTIGCTNSTFTYTITGTSPCIDDVSIATINIYSSPTATITYAAPFCNSNATLQSPTVVGTNVFTGGTYSITPVAATTPTIITINPITGQITPSASTTGGSYAVTYSIPAAIPSCFIVTATTTIVINNQPNAGADGATTTCDSSTIPVNLATLITGEQAGGFWSRTTGTGGIFDVVGGTFTPTIGCTNSTFTYTITGTSPCIDDVSIATININTPPTVSIAGSTSICPNTGTNIIFTGTPGATVTYTVNTGVNQTIPLDSVTGIATLLTGNLAIATSYTLVSVQNPVTTCSQAQVGSVVIGLNALPTILLRSLAATSTQTICANVGIDAIKYKVGPGVTNVDLVWTSTAAVPLLGVTGVFNATTGEFTISGSPSPLPLPTVNTTYTYTLTTVGGCAPNATATGTIIVTPAPTIALTSPALSIAQTVCNNSAIGNITYEIGGTATGAGIPVGQLPTGVTGTYTAGAAGLPGLFTITGTPNVTASGVFNYTLTTTGGCTTGGGVGLSGTITVTKKPIPTVQGGTICLDLAGNPNGTFTIQAKLEGQIDDTNHTYIWSNNTTGTPVVIAGQTASAYTATSPGIYTVKAVPNLNNSCLSDIVSVVVSPVVPPASAVTVTSDYFSDLQTITVAVTPAGVYEYQIDNGVFQKSNIFQVVGSRSHDIVVRNECGTVTVIANIINFPKVFTPNGDGLNDTWNISELSTQPKAKIYIFDRFGKLVKEIAPSGVGWNGTFNTQELPATDYWFTLSYEEKGIMKELKSHFALKR